MTYTISITDWTRSHKKYNIFEGLVSHTAQADFVVPHLGPFDLMEVFTFPELSEIETSLRVSGKSQGEIDEVIKGLRTLPEYKGV